MVDRIADILPQVRQEAVDGGLTHPVLGRLEEGVSARVAECRKVLGHG